MKNKDLDEFKRGLESVGKLKGVRFQYAVIKNKKLVEDELEIINKTIEYTPAYSEYESKRVAICEKYVDRTDSGDMIIENNNYVITTNKELFEKEFDALKTEYATTIADRTNQIKEYEKLLIEESSISEKLIKVSATILPDDMTGEQMEAIFEMITD
jgi:hypothetical protein